MWKLPAWCKSKGKPFCCSSLWPPTDTPTGLSCASPRVLWRPVHWSPAISLTCKSVVRQLGRGWHSKHSSHRLEKKLHRLTWLSPCANILTFTLNELTFFLINPYCQAVNDWYYWTRHHRNNLPPVFLKAGETRHRQRKACSVSYRSKEILLARVMGVGLT